MTEPQVINVTVFSANRWSRSNWPENAREFIKWVAAKLDTVPEQYRDEAEIRLEYESDYEGGGDLVFELSYQRPETDEEIAERLARDAEYKREAEARDRAQYERLKARFGGK